MIESSLLVKDFGVGYGEISLIRDLSLQIPSPTFIAIVGHNGCGKSSFFKALTGEIAYSGEIWINDRQLVRGKKKSNAFKDVAYLGQKNTVNFEIPVRELLVMGRFRKKSFLENYDHNDYTAAEAAAAQFSISHILDKDFNQLSGGEQQLAWLVQLSLQDTPVYCLDEPTQQLDVYNRKKVFQIMNDWASEKIILCVTHDLNNLNDMEGAIINFSEEKPALEKISRESVQKHLDFLRKRKKSQCPFEMSTSAKARSSGVVILILK